MALHKSEHRLGVGWRLQDVHLVDYHDDFLAPGANTLEECPLAFTEWAIGRSHEDDQVSAGDEVLGDLLVAQEHCIRAWRVDDVDVAQPLRRIRQCEYFSLILALARLFTIFQQLNLGGGGRGAFTEKALTEQGINDGRLAGVELAYDDQQKQSVELLEGAIKDP